MTCRACGSEGAAAAAAAAAAASESTIVGDRGWKWEGVEFGGKYILRES